MILEAERTEEPRPGFLEGLRELSSGNGALFVLDEMITGFRWNLGGAQAEYGLDPDLSTFGKAVANGFSVSALVGKREIMELGGLRHRGERVFLLSTTHGAETHSLAAAVATMGVYREQPVIETLHERGARLRAGLEAAAGDLGIDEFFQVVGRASNLVYITRDAAGAPSQPFRTLFLQEMLARGFLFPSLVVGGVAVLLAEEGTATFEFPHLARLLEGVQYDTIYHEHFSYFTLFSICRLVEAHGLVVVDVEELAGHGGSLRVYVGRSDKGLIPTEAVGRVLDAEGAEGLRGRERYGRFADDVTESKRALLTLLIELKRAGKQIVGYGAPGKGNTLLNYCGIRVDFLDYTVDRNPYKHGTFTPGTHIPIHPTTRIAETKPDATVSLPWNLAQEIRGQLASTAERGAQLVIPIPTATVLGPSIDGSVD